MSLHSSKKVTKASYGHGARQGMVVLGMGEDSRYVINKPDESCGPKKDKEKGNNCKHSSSLCVSIKSFHG